MMTSTKFKERFRQLILSTDLPQTEIAKGIGIHKTQLWIYFSESQKGLPRTVNIIKICEYFNVSADWLLGLSDRRGRNQ